MASQVDSLNRSFVANAAISAFRLVKVHTVENEVVAATNGAAIGFTQNDASAAGMVNVKLFHPTYLATVSGAGVAAGSVLHAVAAGTVASAGGVTGVGIAINDGTTGDVIEVAVPRSSIS
jgi:hypothetical protein